jgi:hypothetical protein
MIRKTPKYHTACDVEVQLQYVLSVSSQTPIRPSSQTLAWGVLYQSLQEVLKKRVQESGSTLSYRCRKRFWCWVPVLYYAATGIFYFSLVHRPNQFISIAGIQYTETEGPTQISNHPESYLVVTPQAKSQEDTIK